MTSPIDQVLSQSNRSTKVKLRLDDETYSKPKQETLDLTSD